MDGAQPQGGCQQRSRVDGVLGVSDPHASINGVTQVPLALPCEALGPAWYLLVPCILPRPVVCGVLGLYCAGL